MNKNGVAFITGSAKRIGGSLALTAAKEGYDIILHYRTSKKEVELLATQIEALGRGVEIVQGDFLHQEDLQKLTSFISDRDDISLLVNNASIFENLDWKKTTKESWERHFTINLTTPFLLSQAFGSTKSEKESGRIINLLDWRSFRSDPTHLPYTVSKAALASLTQNLAVAFAPNIAVNALSLGAVLPPMDRGATNDIIANVPIKRWSEVEEVEQTFRFLLSAPFSITGETIHVDGGRHLV